jgi:hypothetical protein
MNELGLFDPKVAYSILPAHKVPARALESSLKPAAPFPDGDVDIATLISSPTGRESTARALTGNGHRATDNAQLG